MKYWSEKSIKFSKSLEGSAPKTSDRLGIYQNSSFEIKMAALIQTFEFTYNFLEEEGFRAYARDYLLSLSYYPRDLNLLGASFPDFLAQHTEAKEYGFLEDLALLDFKLHSLYCGLISEGSYLFRCSEESAFALYLILFDEEVETHHSFLLKRGVDRVSIYPQECK